MTIDIVKREHGAVIYMDDTRVVGSKPWGYIIPTITINATDDEVRHIIRVCEDALKRKDGDADERR